MLTFDGLRNICFNYSVQLHRSVLPSINDLVNNCISIQSLLNNISTNLMVIPDKRYENSLALNLSEPLDERTQNSTL